MSILGISEEAYENMSPAERDEAQRLYQENIQWHHDLYMALSRAGQITPDREEDLALAQLREAKGEVTPLGEGEEVGVLEKMRNLNDPDRDYGD
jgi:hypothetical protein